MTRWLDEEEQRTWRAYLAMSELLYATLDRQLQREAGMTHGTYVVLAMLSEAPDRSLRMTDLARLANSTPSRLSHAMARMEERGWVTRCRASEDGRGTVATLTDAGWEVLVATAPGHVAAGPGSALRPAHPGADAGAGRGPHHRAGRAGPGGDAAPPGAGGRLPAGRAGRLTGRLTGLL